VNENVVVRLGASSRIISSLSTQINLHWHSEFCPAVVINESYFELPELSYIVVTNLATHEFLDAVAVQCSEDSAP
jgi:hypothetical protein